MRCAHCGNEKNDGEVFVKNRHGSYVCPSCLTLQYQECEHCHETYHCSTIYTIQPTYFDTDSSRYRKRTCKACRKCKNSLYATCQYCNDLFKKDEKGALFHINSNGIVARTCPRHSHMFKKCDICGDFSTQGSSFLKRITKEQATAIGDHLVDALSTKPHGSFSNGCDTCRSYAAEYEGHICERCSSDPAVVSTMRHCSECMTLFNKDEDEDEDEDDEELRGLCMIHRCMMHMCDCGHRDNRTRLFSFMPGSDNMRKVLHYEQSRETVDDPDLDDSAGEPFTVGDLQLPLLSELAGKVLCRDCGSMVLVMSNNVKPIKLINSSHSYTPLTLCFHRHDNDDESNPLFLGIELEVDAVTSVRVAASAEQIARDTIAITGSKHAYMKVDGSLISGYEQVTHPATLRYMLANRDRYEALLDIPKKYGLRSHDAGTCGLHVHVSRKFMWNKDEINSLSLLVDRLWVELFMFSRRRDKDIRWAKRITNIRDSLNIARDPKYSEAKVSQYVKNPTDRYMSLNLCKDATAEFRIFRGTMNAVTFWATLQLVDNMVRFNHEHGLAPDATWMDIIKYHQYDELDDYNERTVKSGWDKRDDVAVTQLDDSGSVLSMALDVGKYIPLKLKPLRDIGKVISVTDVFRSLLKIGGAYLFKNELLLRIPDAEEVEGIGLCVSAVVPVTDQDNTDILVDSGELFFDYNKAANLLNGNVLSMLSGILNMPHTIYLKEAR